METNPVGLIELDAIFAMCLLKDSLSCLWNCMSSQYKVLGAMGSVACYRVLDVALLATTTLHKIELYRLTLGFRGALRSCCLLPARQVFWGAVWEQPSRKQHTLNHVGTSWVPSTS